jgi:predicted metal-dependent phosphoesterase TrpH
MSRADLHVHSCHSRISGTLRFLRSRDCYSSPQDVYRTAKRRGMDIVTITDHDAIDGWRELLDARPDATDVLPGEEVSCRFPDGGIEVHLGVYGITEALHDELQPLRRNVFDVTARLRESRTFFALNHLLHFYRRQVALESYLRLLADVPALEVRNGSMLESHNLLVERLSEPGAGASRAFIATAGSDAHTPRRIGRTWTEAPGATAAEFLASLAAGRSQPGGAHGGTAAVAGDVYGVIARYAASLYGGGPPDHRGWHRALCAVLVAASLPAQFLPAAIAAIGKSREGRAVAAAAGAIDALTGPAGGRAAEPARAGVEQES